MNNTSQNCPEQEEVSIPLRQVSIPSQRLVQRDVGRVKTTEFFCEIFSFSKMKPQRQTMNQGTIQAHNQLINVQSEQEILTSNLESETQEIDSSPSFPNFKIIQEQLQALSPRDPRLESRGDDGLKVKMCGFGG